MSPSCSTSSQISRPSLPAPISSNVSPPVAKTSVSLSVSSIPFFVSAPNNIPISSYNVFSSSRIDSSILGVSPSASVSSVPDPPSAASVPSISILYAGASPNVVSVSDVSPSPVADPYDSAYRAPALTYVLDDYLNYEDLDDPLKSLEAFLALYVDSKSRKEKSLAFSKLCNTLPPPSAEPYTPLQLAAVAVSEQFSQNPFIASDAGVLPTHSIFAYKKVANKVRPVATTLPENFRIIRHDHPDPLANMLPLPIHPPNFVPVGRFTRERRDEMSLGHGLLLPEEIKLAEWIVINNDTAFAWTDDERGSFDPKYFAPIEVPVISHVLWMHRQGPIPRGILSQVTKVIQDKWTSGAYEPSSSSYNSRWFCVLKKDGKSLRIVHSLEPLNSVTIKNAAMPPYTEMLAEDFAGRSVYTTLDLYVAFDQRQLHERSRDMTTFTTPLGAFRLTVLPMGWTNSPAILQGDISHILRPEIPHCTLPFIDDVPIKGPRTRYQLPDGSFETIPGNPGIRRFVWEHLESVHCIITQVKAYGGTFSGKKSFIGVPRTVILGHTCTYEGRVVDQSKIQAIVDWPIPQDVTQVRAFLGTCGVFRIFIKGYTLVACPLINLTRKDVPFEFGPSQLCAMELLKEAIVNSPALVPINYESDNPVILAVDSCANGTGYILFQKGDDGKRYPSRFGSITFNDRESRYSQAKLELYGLFQSLKATQLFTIGVKKLIVEMDAKFIKGMINNPTLHPNNAVNRWISAILLFDFELVHVPAEKHTGADGLSRRPHATTDPSFETEEELDDWIDSNSNLFLDIANPPSPYDPAPPWNLGLGCLTVSVEEDEHLKERPSSTPPASQSESPPPSDLEPIDIEIPRSPKALLRNAKLLMIRRFLENLERPSDLSDEQYRLFIRQAMGYYAVSGLLFRKNPHGGPQLVPDVSRRSAIIRYAHDALGHKGIFATTRNILIRFWWPYLNNDVRWFIRTCHQCQVCQTKYFHIPPSVPHVPSLFRKAHIDTFLMPKQGSYRYVIHARCALTSYPEARATTVETAVVIADFIFQDILCRWGALEELVTDNGAPYIAAANILAERYGIHHIRVSGYNSQANGIVESKHFDVREAIMKTCEGKTSAWRQVLHQVLWAERVTICRSTGFSPYYMAHGVHPLLPFDIIEATYLCPGQDFGISTEELVAIRARQLAKCSTDLQAIRSSVTEARVQALKRFEERHAAQICDFDFQPGALVLVRNSGIEKSLDHKAKEKYIGPMVAVRKTIGTSYIVAELDGAEAQQRVAGFRLIPYFSRT